MLLALKKTIFGIIKMEFRVLYTATGLVSTGHKCEK